MPQYPVKKDIGDLTALSATLAAGKIPIAKQHINQNIDVVNTLIEKLVNAVFSGGGKIAGTFDDSGNPTVNLADFIGITKDALTVVWVDDEDFDLSAQGKSDGQYSLVVEAVPVAGSSFNFEFADSAGTVETVTHTMNVSLGQLALRDGDAGSSPSIILDGDVEIARLTLSSGTWTVNSEITTGPTFRAASLSQPLDATLTALAALGIGDNQLILGTGTDTAELVTLISALETFLKAASVSAAQQALDLEPGVDIATAAQGALADSALQPSAIGVSVQAYDVDTAKLDVAQTFTALQTFDSIDIVKSGNSARFVGHRSDSSVGVLFGAASSRVALTFSNNVYFRFQAANLSDILSGNLSASTSIPLQAQADGKVAINRGGSTPIYDLDVGGDARIIGRLLIQSYTVGALPSALNTAKIIVSNDELGQLDAQSDGTNWRRVRDGLIVRAETSTADDQVRTFPDAFTTRRRLVAIWCKSNNSYGLFLVGNGALALITGSNFAAGATGTTPSPGDGTDGVATVYENAGVIYVSNRLGGARTLLMAGL